MTLLTPSTLWYRTRVFRRESESRGKEGLCGDDLLWGGDLRRGGRTDVGPTVTEITTKRGEEGVVVRYPLPTGGVSVWVWIGLYTYPTSFDGETRRSL